LNFSGIAYTKEVCLPEVRHRSVPVNKKTILFAVLGLSISARTLTGTIVDLEVTSDVETAARNGC